MTGSGRDVDTEAGLVCLHLNFQTENSKIGMIDSGCNNPMQSLTDDVRECVMDYDPKGRITGDQVHGEFTTDASGTLGITLQGLSRTDGQAPAMLVGLMDRRPRCLRHACILGTHSYNK